MNMLTSIVVTGASGFVGSKLVKCLQKFPNFKVYPISKTQQNSNYLYVKSFSEIPKSDIIFHLGQTSNRALVNQNETLVKEALEDLDLITAQKFKKIIFCSSASVYGDKGFKPFAENELIYEYDNYSLMKILSEKKVIEKDGCVLRLTNVIGENMSLNTVLMDIINQLGNSEKIIVKDIGPVRDFVSIGYVVSSMIKILNLDASGIFNLGSGKGTSIKQLIELILSLADQKDREFTFKNKTVEYSYNVVDTKKIIRLIGNENNYSVTDSIIDLIKYEKKNNINFYR